MPRFIRGFFFIIMTIKKDIEKKFYSELSQFCKKRILACVSGGVDSMVMLHLLTKFSKELNVYFSVVTVNHRIRSEEETKIDLDLIESYCKLHSIDFYIHVLGDTELKETAEIRNKGIEEAARFLRYQAFRKTFKQTNSDYAFLAHNQDDNLETIIQRFLQGAFGKSASGIIKQREFFYRPLLEISKQEITEYAS